MRQVAPGHRVAALIAAAASVGVVTGCSSAAPTARPVPPARVLSASPAPAGWLTATLPDGGAVLSYPPAMRLVPGDKSAVSVARFAGSGGYLLYLNATPKQGAETLRNWPGFRVDHLKEEEESKVRVLSASHGVRFIGGTGTCVVDAYVTKAKANHYTELACFVVGRTSASVIVAAAPTAGWKAASALLMRAVAAYQVR